MAAFIKTSTGEVLYLMRNRFWKFESLYEDYMGNCYSEQQKHRNEFKLNVTRYSLVRKDILNMKIEQQVRYKEYITKRVNNNEIY